MAVDIGRKDGEGNRMSNSTSLGDRVRRRARRALGDPAVSLEQIDFNSGLGDSASLLYGLARSIKPQVAVEIGSARGRSACFIGQALKENGSGKLYAIDPHTVTSWNDTNSVNTYETMCANVEAMGLTEQVEIVRKMSGEAAAGWTLPIDMLFIDGDHSYDGVRRDWDLFSPFVTQFGVVVFHDTTWELHPGSEYSRDDMGVPRFVEDLRAGGYPVITIDRDFGVSLVQPFRHGVPLAPTP